MEFALSTALNGISYGLLLFMLSAGLTLIFSLMGVLNFAHASFYMLGAYMGHMFSAWVGFWPALLLAPLAVGAFGALVERHGLRPLHRHGHIPELLLTFGLSYLLLEIVQLTWGRTALATPMPAALQGTLLTIYSTSFPVYRGFIMLLAVLMLGAMWLLMTRTRVGLVIQAALTHPETVQALGHNVPRLFMCVFGVGCALAGLAGVVGGIAFVTEPAMAGSMGSIVFVVVVVGGLGSLAGALLASLLIGIVQTVAVTMDVSIASVLQLSPAAPGYAVWSVTVSQAAAILPYLLLVLVLILRPRGLLGKRE